MGLDEMGINPFCDQRGGWQGHTELLVHELAGVWTGFWTGFRRVSTLQPVRLG